MRRAAVSAASNLVEGSSRNSRSEYLRFLEIAYGSLRELGYQADLAKRLEMAAPKIGSQFLPRLKRLKKFWQLSSDPSAEPIRTYSLSASLLH